MVEKKEKTITIGGKTINYGNLSNEKLIQLYNELLDREKAIDRKIAAHKSR